MRKPDGVVGVMTFDWVRERLQLEKRWDAGCDRGSEEVFGGQEECVGVVL